MIKSKEVTFKKEHHDVYCDICSKRAKVGSDIPDKILWENEGKYGHFVGVYVKAMDMEQYPNWATYQAWDICPECFERELEPILNKLAKMREFVG